MGKSKQNIDGLKTIKTTVPPNLYNAIKNIYESTARSESDVLREAISLYIKNNYPHFLQKTKTEIENEFKQKLVLEVEYPKYRGRELTKQNVPLYEESLRKKERQLQECQSLIENIQAKINKTPIPKNKKLKLELEVGLEQEKEHERVLKNEVERYKNTLENTKRGISEGADF